MKRVVFGVALAVVVVCVAACAESFAASIGLIGDKEQLGEVAVVEEKESAESDELPLIKLSTNGQQIQKETSIVAELSIVDSGMKANGEEPSLVSDIALKYRGNSSYLTFDKFSYRVTLLRDGEDGTESRKRDESLLGMAEDSEWVLYGPFLDRSLVRNRVMYGICREIMDWAPDTRWCELMVDDVYQGIYLLVEPVRNSVGRLGLAEFGLLSGETAYIIKRDRPGTETNVIETYGNANGYTSQEVSIAYPSEGNVTAEQRSWIVSDFTQFETALYGDSFADSNVGYAAYIDIGSFVDYLLVNEFAMITDASYLSTYVYKDLGGDEKLKMCVWDFNNGFDNYPWDIKLIDEFHVVDGNWYNRLVQDRAFVDAVCERWTELRGSVLSNDAIVERIDLEYGSLGDALARNTEVWGYTYHESLLNMHEKDGRTRDDPSSPEEAIAMLKDTALARAAWMDEHLDDLYAQCIN